MSCNIFCNHNCIVHQQTHRHQQRHHTDHIDTDAGQGHKKQPTHKGCWQTHRNPEGKPEAEKQPHHQKHQHQSLTTVDQQHLQAITYDGRDILGHGEGDPRRCKLSLALHKSLYRIHYNQGIFGFGFGDLKQRRALAIK